MGRSPGYLVLFIASCQRSARVQRLPSRCYSQSTLAALHSLPKSSGAPMLCIPWYPIAPVIPPRPIQPCPTTRLRPLPTNLLPTPSRLTCTPPRSDSRRFSPPAKKKVLQCCVLLPAFCYLLLASCYPLPATRYRLPGVCVPRPASCFLPTTNCLLCTTSYAIT